MSPTPRLRSRPPDAIEIEGGSRGRPVVLATLAVPFDGEAARVAMQAAMESNSTLVVIDAVERPFWPLAASMGHADLESDDDRELIRRFAGHAAKLGLDVEHLRVRTPRPVEALIQLAGERDAGLLVFGPDPSRLRPRFFGRVVRRIRKRVSCLLWIAGEGP
ncbi:MAG TPA: universal stress protein [Gaiellales bacterium]|jgi:nucleotide-binding universal stress UspA family protein|nr:universal stress protein [Gaiellales bacterium]